MAALTSDRKTLLRDGRDFGFPVAADTRIFHGSIVCLEAGEAVPARTAAGLVAVGIADGGADNRDGAAGDVRVDVRRDMLGHFANSGGADEITLADVGQPAYAVDDQTVAKTDGGGTRSPAGTIRDVDARGVWIEF